MDRNDRELRSSPAILCKIAVAVSRPQLPACIFLLGSALVSYLWKTPAKVGFTSLPPLCPQTISSTPFSNNTSKTDTVYETHLCQ